VTICHIVTRVMRVEKCVEQMVQFEVSQAIVMRKTTVTEFTMFLHGGVVN